jgi:hypothetical protein
MTTKTQLKQVLFDNYGGFADKRLKNIERDAPFIVDDRRESDMGADGRLFLWFCQILVDVIDAERVQITLRGGTPESPAVSDWMNAAGVVDAMGGKQIEIAKGDQDNLLELADRMETIVAKGHRYPVKAYKYVCPRVAASLRQLQKVLAEVWA